jgi:predicted nucleotidyltransferase
MRLSSKEIVVIKALVAKVYGEKAKVFLFGSRTKDALRVGDVDLLIQSEVQHRLNLENKIQFIIHLKEQIGEKKRCGI